MQRFDFEKEQEVSGIARRDFAFTLSHQAEESQSPNQTLEPTRPLVLSFRKINLKSQINSRVAHL